MLRQPQFDLIALGIEERLAWKERCRKCAAERLKGPHFLKLGHCEERAGRVLAEPVDLHLGKNLERNDVAEFSDELGDSVVVTKNGTPVGPALGQAITANGSGFLLGKAQLAANLPKVFIGATTPWEPAKAEPPPQILR